MAERRFVREALLALGSERPSFRDAARGVRNWDRALSLARAGSVAESVWAAVTLRSLQDEVPEPARSAFEEAHVGATARNALLLSEAAWVQSALSNAGIDSLVLKGPGLLVAHYPDVGARHVGDVDLLVGERDSLRADEIVRALGAHERDPLLRHDGTRAEHAEPGEVHSPLVYTAHGVALEMHQAQPGEARGSCDFGGLLARSRTVEWQGRRLRIPSAADLAAGACMHVFDHHDGREKYVPRLLGDLAVTVGTGATTWDEVRERISPQAGRVALETSRRLLEEGPPRGLLAWRHAILVRARHWGGVFADGGRSPFGFARILFRIPESSPLLPLLYLWRPVRGIWSLVTGR
jgi:hypothetical protein